MRFSVAWTWRKLLVVALAAVFVVPLVPRAGAFLFSKPLRENAASGVLPPASRDPQARLIVFTGTTNGWKGVFSIHTWIVLKHENDSDWTRYDVVGWGNPVRINGWAADASWLGSDPEMLVDVRGAEAAALIPKVEAAVKDYRYSAAADYRGFPGPNCNTFTAIVLRAIPELAVALPANAIGRDFREGFYAGHTDSGTGVELSLWGLLGIKLGWVEGIEFNVLGLVAGLDLRHPAVKLPGVGQIGIGVPSAFARARTKNPAT